MVEGIIFYNLKYRCHFLYKPVNIGNCEKLSAIKGFLEVVEMVFQVLIKKSPLSSDVLIFQEGIPRPRKMCFSSDFQKL